jgi:DNA primase
MGFCDIALEQQINSEYYDGRSRYRAFPYSQHLQNKIIVPIKDDCGRLVSFATRGIGKGERWWNTPFKKGNYLFGLNASRSACFHKNKMILMEGYFDVIVSFQQGVQWVGSPMGTRFSVVQAGLAYRYCDRLCVCFDSDFSGDNGAPGAGQRATARILDDENIHPLFEVTMIKLPLGVDPDEYVLANGAATFLALEQETKETEGIQNGNGMYQSRSY